MFISVQGSRLFSNPIVYIYVTTNNYMHACVHTYVLHTFNNMSYMIIRAINLKAVLYTEACFTITLANSYIPYKIHTI